MAHGTSTADNVVSFISSKAKNTSQKQKIKQLKRRRPFVKVSYDSGSDADVESDEDHVKDNVNTATADGRNSVYTIKLNTKIQCSCVGMYM